MAPSDFRNWIEVEKVRDPYFKKKVFALDLEKKFEECWETAQQSYKENYTEEFTRAEEWQEKYEELKEKVESLYYSVQNFLQVQSGLSTKQVSVVGAENAGSNPVTCTN